MKPLIKQPLWLLASLYVLFSILAIWALTWFGYCMFRLME